jgi:hypothetical protein
MKKIVLLLTIALVAGSLGAVESLAQTKVRVKFARASSSATLRGSIKGYRYVDYIVGAKAGQTLSCTVNSPEASVEFVVFKPDTDNLDGMFSETDWSGALPVSGTYTIRVLLPRFAARRKTIANYRLSVSIK